MYLITMLNFCVWFLNNTGRQGARTTSTILRPCDTITPVQSSGYQGNQHHFIALWHNHSCAVPWRGGWTTLVQSRGERATLLCSLVAVGGQHPCAVPWRGGNTTVQSHGGGAPLLCSPVARGATFLCSLVTVCQHREKVRYISSTKSVYLNHY